LSALNQSLTAKPYQLFYLLVLFIRIRGGILVGYSSTSQAHNGIAGRMHPAGYALPTPVLECKMVLQNFSTIYPVAYWKLKNTLFLECMVKTFVPFAAVLSNLQFRK
jgi:hypothetical protein